MDRDKLERALENGLTVGEFIDELRSFDKDSKIAFAYNYGDHWNSQVAQIVETVDENDVKWSEYHRMLKVVEDNGERDDDAQNITEECRKDAETIIIINLR